MTSIIARPWRGLTGHHFVLTSAPMENIHDNQLATFFKGLASAFGRDEVLALAERTLLGTLCGAESKPTSMCVTPSDTPRLVHSNGEAPSASKVDRVAARVLGLPDGYTWDQAPVEVKLAKGALRSAMAEPHGVVLRHGDSTGGDLYYAVYDKGSKTFQVPAGYRSSRGQAAEVTLNGAYRWLLVGVARSVAPNSRRTKGNAKATLTQPKWRGREYEPCHEEMAHSGNVRAGSLVRNILTGTLDYVAECDGRTALMERENGDLDDISLTAQPSKSLRVVGYSSQYAQEVASRG